MFKPKPEQPLPPGMKVLDLSEYRDSAEVERIRQQMAAKLPPMPRVSAGWRMWDTISYTIIVFSMGVIVGAVLMHVH